MIIIIVLKHNSRLIEGKALVISEGSGHGLD
jgi:hypothetical protein